MTKSGRKNVTVLGEAQLETQLRDVGEIPESGHRF